MRRVVALAVLLASAPADAQPAATAPAAPELEAVVRADAENLRTWTQDPAILGAVREQNALKVPLSRIRAIDISWLAESDNPRMQSLLKNPCAKSLLGFTGARPGYREAFVMDDQGALVCMTRKTSDYWQGDEDKWRKGFAGGRGAVFVSEPEKDDSTGATLVHVSVPILDGGKAIGVVTAGIDFDLLQKRAKKQ